MKGYKVFNPDWTCKGFQYEVGKTYEEYVDLKCCERGFHFCERAADCFNYYSFDPENKVAEVEAIGKVVTEGDKSCTNKIRIVREITWEEVLRIVNTGKSCTGLRNSGNWNSGDRNKTSFSSGCFNTEESNILMFNKPSKWSHSDWFGSEARYLLSLIKHDVLEWICLDDMTEEEKHEHPEAETTGGYLKRLDESQCGQLWWNELSEENKKIIKDMPNFDQSVFEEITGIKIG